MSDTWSSDAERFNKVHAPAGSAAGGQFAPASGSSSAGGKAAGGGKAAHPRSTPSNQHPVGRGETGKRVSDLQERLNTLGFKPALKVDGIFGPKTLAAVKAFQVSHGLKVDGLVGPLTTAALRARPKAKAAQHGTARPSAHVTAPKTAPAKTARRGSDLKYGHGSALWDYWTRGAGFAKWSGAVHKWTTLHALLLKAGVPAISADGLTTNIIQAVMPGYMKQAHAKAARADTKAPYGTGVAYGDPGYLDADGNQASKSGKPGVKRYPLSADKVMAAWSYINQAKNAGQYTPTQLSAIKGRIRAAMDKHGHDVMDKPSAAVRAEYMRMYPLEDIHILTRAEGDGTGRVVEAYATVFDQEAEIHDHQGHYREVIDRSAFDRILQHITRTPGGLAAEVKVLFNHGRTIGGAEAPEFQLPLGKPLDVRPEDRGLLTRTEYDTSDPFTERILSKIHAGTITAQSFVGGIIRSAPELRGPGDRHRARNGVLTTVRRTELGLREYGPVLYPAYSGAEILGVRMQLPGSSAEDAPDSPEDEEYAPDMDGDGTGGTPEDVTSARYHQHALYRMTSEEAREKAGLVW